jgi:hypothetical protein
MAENIFELLLLLLVLGLLVFLLLLVLLVTFQLAGMDIVKS